LFSKYAQHPVAPHEHDPQTPCHGVDAADLTWMIDQVETLKKDIGKKGQSEYLRKQLRAHFVFLYFRCHCDLFVGLHVISGNKEGANPPQVVLAAVRKISSVSRWINQKHNDVWPPLQSRWKAAVYTQVICVRLLGLADRCCCSFRLRISEEELAFVLGKIHAMRSTCVIIYLRQHSKQHKKQI